MPRRNAFSLIELVIILAIIGLLASIAVPRLLAFRVRSAQVEMKTNLSALLTTEKVYLAEHQSYTDNLSLTGWAPEGRPVYLYGFTSDGLPAPSGLNDTAELKASGGGSYDTSAMIDTFGNPLTGDDLPPCTVSKTSLTAGATANLDDDPTMDSWTLDEAGNLSAVSNDASE
ncbi:MAG: type II secretion system protein [Myxococcota bacterium]